MRVSPRRQLLRHLPQSLQRERRTFTFLKNILTEVMQLFPSTDIHVGGDEAVKDQWKASPQIQAQMKALGIRDEDQLQSHFIKSIDTFPTAHDATLGWDEILEGGLAPMQVMSWRIQAGIAAARQGHTLFSRRPVRSTSTTGRAMPPMKLRGDSAEYTFRCQSFPHRANGAHR